VDVLEVCCTSSRAAQRLQSDGSGPLQPRVGSQLLWHATQLRSALLAVVPLVVPLDGSVGGGAAANVLFGQVDTHTPA
jgi:hypothetical protein